MTMDELIAALWAAKATVRLNDNRQPVLKGTVSADVLAALREHRETVIEMLRGTKCARLEGLVCGKCVPSSVPESIVERERMDLRWCEACRWSMPHYPRTA